MANAEIFIRCSFLLLLFLFLHDNRQNSHVYILASYLDEVSRTTTYFWLYISLHRCSLGRSKLELHTYPIYIYTNLWGRSEITRQAAHVMCGLLSDLVIYNHPNAYDVIHDTECHYWDQASLTLTLPGPSAGVSGSLDIYCSIKPLCSGMGEVVPARTSPTLLPPSPRTVLSLSCCKVSQCINCRDCHFKS